MRALVVRLNQDGEREKILVDDWPAPGNPTGRQALVQTLYSAITNGTERGDLIKGNYAHPDTKLPRGRGYQNVGIVVLTGPECTIWNPGDMVFSSRDHQEFVLAEEANLAIRLPVGVSPEEASLLGLASVAARTVSSARPENGDRILLAGAGLLGLFILQFLKAKGAKVTVCDVNQNRLEVAESLGADDTVFSDDAFWGSESIEESVDAVIDAAGVPEMEDRMLTAVRTGGQIVLAAGRFRVDYNFNLGQMREITIRQNNHFTQTDLEGALQCLMNGTLLIRPLLRDIVSINDADTVYRKLVSRPDDLLGVVFDWR